MKKDLSLIIVKLKPLLASLSAHKAVGHIELSACNEGVSVLIRHVKPLTNEDLSHLCSFAGREDCLLFLQPGDGETIHKVWPKDDQNVLSYPLALADRQLELSYHPKDFTQINLGVNQKMVQMALDMLELNARERALDLFSGLGNFTLAMATHCEAVVGVEGSQEMVARGERNTQRNQINNARFFETNLYADFSNQDWAQDSYDKILIDPPRAGALEIVNDIDRFGAKRIVYISCNPATLARDAGILIQKGYYLRRAGILDMFPHTEHLESIAVFDRK